MQTATQPQQSSLSKEKLWKLWYADNQRKANIMDAEACDVICCVCCGSLVVKDGKYSNITLPNGLGSVSNAYLKMHAEGKGGVELSIGHTFEELKTLWPAVADKLEHYETVVDDKAYTVTWKDS